MQTETTLSFPAKTVEAEAEAEKQKDIPNDLLWHLSGVSPWDLGSSRPRTTELHNFYVNF